MFSSLADAKDMRVRVARKLGQGARVAAFGLWLDRNTGSLKTRLK